MKTLILMRHAKSGWNAPLTDMERTLTARGAADARNLGTWITSQTLAPDDILCSYAVRTMETVQRLNLDIPYTPIRKLYLAPTQTLLEHLAHARGNTVLMVAHNPGIADLAHDLTRAPVAHSRFADYPTGATSVFTFEITTWTDISLKSGTRKHFVTPHDL